MSTKSQKPPKPRMRGNFLDLTRAVTITPELWGNGINVVPDENFPDPGMANGGYLVALSPFGPCVVGYRRYCWSPQSGPPSLPYEPTLGRDWFLTIGTIDVHDIFSDSVQEHWQEILAFAAEYGVEHVGYRGKFIHVGTPKSRACDKVRRELAEVATYQSYLKETLATLEAQP